MRFTTRHALPFTCAVQFTRVNSVLTLFRGQTLVENNHSCDELHLWSLWEELIHLKTTWYR